MINVTSDGIVDSRYMDEDLFSRFTNVAAQCDPEFISPAHRDVYLEWRNVLADIDFVQKFIDQMADKMLVFDKKLEDRTRHADLKHDVLFEKIIDIDNKVVLLIDQRRDINEMKRDVGVIETRLRSVESWKGKIALVAGLLTAGIYTLLMLFGKQVISLF